jgi:transposase
MTQKRSYKQYPKELKEEAVALVTEQGYTVPKAAEALGVAANILYRWKDNAEKQKAGITLSSNRLQQPDFMALVSQLSAHR